MLLCGIGYACTTNDRVESDPVSVERLDSLLDEVRLYRTELRYVKGELDSMKQVYNQDYAALSPDLEYLFKSVNRTDSLRAAESGDLALWKRRAKRTSAFLGVLKSLL